MLFLIYLLVKIPNEPRSLNPVLPYQGITELIAEPILATTVSPTTIKGFMFEKNCIGICGSVEYQVELTSLKSGGKIMLTPKIDTQ
jgi:hypothetical protein